ncbi:heavy metal translocating P-type ATPase [Nocardia sp. NPDC127579]|uniref:heavy metal translocating P-type ATPase n=1 Tax=Nocardia sp. NPDC127579 TaxID=3345402 RepID=UPI0036296397
MGPEHTHAAADPQHAHGGHADHVAQFRKLFWVMAVLAIPVVVANMMFADLLGYTVPENLSWVSPLGGTVMFFWGGRPFLTGAISEIRSGQPGMMLLIGLAITVAFLASWGATTGLLAHDLDFWWELALLIVIMLLGHWIEMRSLGQASSALESLAALLPDEAERFDDHGSISAVATSDLRAGDLVVVRPGGRVPADGTVESGSADLDESMITGESRPVRRTAGDRVTAGTVSTDSALRVRITAVGEDTALAGIQRLVAEAQNSSSRAQVLADRAAGRLFWFAAIAAVITAVTWLILGEPESAIARTITVLVIACPHALGLAIPLVVSIATERAAAAGILITDRRALEAMRTVDAVLFDKTGTLTRGEPAVTALTATGIGENDLLAAAAAAESDSEHPLGRAIVTAATDRDLAIPTATEFTARNGIGVTATIDGGRISVGGPGLLADHGLDPLPETGQWAEQGATVLHVLRDDVVVGALALADEIRPESEQAVRALHARGIHVAMITGDAESVARTVAARLGIDEVFAGVLPEDKGAKIEALQNAGHTVAMVGDGVNDAPALARADVGIAIGAGTDVAIASAGVVLVGDDPRSVVSVITLSQATYRKMIQNLSWAAGYNIIAVPLAAGVLSHWGITLPMEIGALLMSASTVVVAVNAQLLRRLDLRPADRGEAHGDVVSESSSDHRARDV